MTPLLPNEPRVADERQRGLTERYLLPALASIEAFFLHLRGTVDGELAARIPVKLGKPYPMGQCLEIAQAVQGALRDVDAGTLPPAAQPGHAALVAFLANGGNARIVWGALRGRYFQNAYLFGTLYVDVANDTVVPTKPKVEVLPFARAGLTPVRDHRHFALLAQSYWNAQVVPNHVLPDVAPYAPLVTLTPGGSVRLACASDYMRAMTAAGGFVSSAAVLDAPPMPDNLFHLLAETLAEAGITAAADAHQGRARALSLCRGYRDARRHPGDAGDAAVYDLLSRANAQLSTLVVTVTERRAA